VATKKSDSKVLVFYSYSHKDERYRNRLGVSLSLLRREGAIEEWFDRRITAGDQWADEIAQQMDAAQLILLLVSPDFIASDYCYGKELTQAIERNNRGKAWVIPIIVRPCEFSGTPFAKLQALPTDAKPVTVWGNRDNAWLNVQQGISKAVKEIAAGVNSTIASGGASIVRSADDAPPKRPAKAKGKTKAPARVKPVKRAKATHTATIATVKKMGERAAARPGGEPKRVIYDAQGTATLPGKVARREGKPAKGDPAVDETYEWLGTTYHFFWDLFKRDSWDGKGAELAATVHYDKKYNNAFWNGKHMIIGDGDNKLFKRFSLLDIVAKEFATGVIQTDTKLRYWEQSGTILNSIALVFGILVKQYALKETADQSHWQVAEGIFPSGVNGRALQSFAAPGTAYDDKILGKDPQPAHMSGFVRTSDDNGGIHTNSGIPNHAFYQVATAIGGFAWEKAGRIWYDAMRDKQLKADARFSDFARITLQHAKKLFGPSSVEAAAVKEGWGIVGVKIR
jgi:hypothetical protein